MALIIFRLLVLCFFLQIPISQTAFCQTDHMINGGDKKAITKKTPVVRWTANRDEMNFRYNFLKNLEHINLNTATPEMGTFNHHPYITYFKGVFYAIWDIHIRDENAAGQHGLLRRSTDQGKTWTPVEVLFPPPDKIVPVSEEANITRFQNADGFAVVDDKLYAVTSVDEYRRTSNGRRRINIGQLCRSLHPEGSLGKIFWLLPEAPEPVPDFPAYPAGDPSLVEKIINYFRQPGNIIQLRYGPEGHHPTSDDNHRLSEPVPAYKLTDGTWVRMYRDTGEKNARKKNARAREESKSRRNYASFSFDDGQVYVINNVLPLSTKKGGRSLLGISLSQDGLNFDRVAVIRFIALPKRYKGRAKSIGYAYPHSFVVEDNLWVIYSVNKEDIQLTRIPLIELYKL